MLTIAACTSAGDAASSRIHLRFAVLLADGRVLVVAPGDDQPWREYRADSAAVHQLGGYFLAQSSDAQYLVAALPRADLSATTLLVIDLGTRSVVSRVVRDSGGSFTTLALGPRSGLAYLVGAGSGGVVVSTFAIPSLAETGRRVGRFGAGVVYATSLDLEEDRLYVSFHEWTDWFTLGESSLDRCRVPSAVSAPCILSHGLLRPVPGGVIYATGGPAFHLAAADGQIDTIPIALEGNHLMDFAVDSADHRLVAVGSCGYAGGFATAPLPGDRTRAPISAQRPRSTQHSICGERVAVEPRGRWAVVARRAPPPYASRGAGEITIVDTESGEVLRRISVPAPPLDVIVLRD